MGTRRGRGSGRSAFLKAGPLEIDRHRREVRMKGRRVPVTDKELALLVTLVGTPGRVFRREELLALVWSDRVVEPRTIDVHLARLRRRFTAMRLPPPRIDTVHGVGYRFREAGAREPDRPRGR